MLGKTTTALLIASLSGCHPAFAEAPCEYDKTVETNWTQQIEKTSNISDAPILEPVARVPRFSW